MPGGIDFIPEAMIDDGMLDVVVMSPRSAIGWLAMYAKILLQAQAEPAGDDLLPLRQDHHPHARNPMPTQLDGDPSGEATKVTVQVAPGPAGPGEGRRRH